MITLDEHSCSYHCDRPECIKAQRDELRATLERVKAAEAGLPVSETVAWMTEFGRVISVKEKEWAVSKIDEGGEFAITAKAALSYNIKLGVIK